MPPRLGFSPVPNKVSVAWHSLLGWEKKSQTKAATPVLMSRDIAFQGERPPYLQLISLLDRR